MIYRIIAESAFILMFVLVVLSSRKHAVGILKYFKKPQGLAGFLRILVYLFMMLSFFIMAISAMIPVTAGAGHLSGIMLIVHVVLAPVFIGSLAVFIILTAYRMEFHSEDLEKIRNGPPAKQDIFWQKLIFWLFAAAASTAVLAIIPMLFPVFGSEGLDVLLNIHRVAAVSMILIAAAHFWLFRPATESD